MILVNKRFRACRLKCIERLLLAFTSINSIDNYIIDNYSILIGILLYNDDDYPKAFLLIHSCISYDNDEYYLCIYHLSQFTNIYHNLVNSSSE